MVQGDITMIPLPQTKHTSESEDRRLAVIVLVIVFLLGLICGKCFANGFGKLEEKEIFSNKEGKEFLSIQTESDGFTRISFMSHGGMCGLGKSEPCYMTIAKDGELFEQFRNDGKKTRLSMNVVCDDCHEDFK